MNINVQSTSPYYATKDEITEKVEVNRLTRPVLMEYYNKAEELWN